MRAGRTRKRGRESREKNKEDFYFFCYGVMKFGARFCVWQREEMGIRVLFVWS